MAQSMLHWSLSGRKQVAGVKWGTSQTIGLVRKGREGPGNVHLTRWDSNINCPAGCKTFYKKKSV